MDLNNPFNFSSNFLDLPQYSTQYSNIGGESDDPNLIQTTSDRRETRRKWSPSEDVVLINAWLNTSKDPIVGNEQKACAFWKRIVAYFSNSSLVANLPKREWNHCKQIWQKVNDSVCKFVGCYDQALSQKTSGQSEDDVFQVSYQFYYNNYKTNFTLEHSWRELRHDKKWSSLHLYQNSKGGGGSSKRTKFNEGGIYSSSSNPKSPITLDGEEQAMDQRPLGVKSSKRKGKKVATKTTIEEREASARSRLENLWVLKEKDIAERKNLAKMELLKSLLAKIEQLSEKEEALKNQFIDEML